MSESTCSTLGRRETLEARSSISRPSSRSKVRFFRLFAPYDFPELTLPLDLHPQEDLPSPPTLPPSTVSSDSLRPSRTTGRARASTSTLVSPRPSLFCSSSFKLSQLTLSRLTVAPGYISTEMNSALIADPTRSRQILERIPSKRWGTPDDFSGAVLFLAGGGSDYVCGECLTVSLRPR